MKRFVLILFPLIVAISCFAQIERPDCNTFKKGKFMYINDSSNKVFITRKNKLQEEFEPQSGIRTLWRIRWIADCEYELIQISSNNKRKRKQNGRKTKIKIINTYNDRYDYTCGCGSDENSKKNGTVIIMKE